MFMEKSLKRTKSARFLLAALLLAVMGCKDGFTGDGNEDILSDLAPSLFVRTGGSDENDGLTAETPFATLAYAYRAALADPERKTITVLSNLDAGSGAMELDPTGVTVNGKSRITITGNYTLTRTSSAGNSVVYVTGGAKVVFRNINITGGESRALFIYGPDNEVTLENTAFTGKAPQFSGGGGIFLRNGTADGVAVPVSKLTMNGGTIYGESTVGGGVLLDGSTEFEMIDGMVSGSCSNFGGGVYVEGGKFSMKGGTVSGISVSGSGGGVCVKEGGEFIMDGGMVGNSIAASCGGGVYVPSGTFTMNGNSAANDGGGVYIMNGGIYTKNGGTVTDNTPNNEVNKNNE
jgi:hypothetical protein